MRIFRCNIDRDMVNTGTKLKPFLSARMEVRKYYCGSVRYCTISVEKTMSNIGDDDHPYYVKIYELVTVKVFGIEIRNKEKVDKFDKL